MKHGQNEGKQNRIVGEEAVLVCRFWRFDGNKTKASGCMQQRMDAETRPAMGGRNERRGRNTIRCESEAIRSDRRRNAEQTRAELTDRSVLLTRVDVMGREKTARIPMQRGCACFALDLLLGQGNQQLALSCSLNHCRPAISGGLRASAAWTHCTGSGMQRQWRQVTGREWLSAAPLRAGEKLVSA